MTYAIKDDDAFWNMEDEWLLHTCPPCLGFDVILQLKYKVKSYTKDELATYHIKAILMSCEQGWIDIKAGMPDEWLRQIVSDFNDLPPEEEDEDASPINWEHYFLGQSFRSYASPSW